MTISNVSSSNVYQLPNQQNGAGYSIRKLSQSLQSGDLAGAQQAYNTLSQLPQFQTTSTSQTSSGQSSDFAQVLSQIGTALQSGDIASAQQSFANLQAQWQGRAQANAATPNGQAQGAGGHHHHHHHSGGGSEESANTADNSSSADAISPLNLIT